MKKAKDYKEYCMNYPVDAQKKLDEMRVIIKRAAPKAQEVISYSMPAFKQHGILVYFAAQSKHIGFYPTSSGIREFEHEFDRYKYSKGAVQFPYDEPLPAPLISRIVKFRVKEDNNKLKAKKAK